MQFSTVGLFKNSHFPDGTTWFQFGINQAGVVEEIRWVSKTNTVTTKIDKLPAGVVLETYKSSFGKFETIRIRGTAPSTNEVHWTMSFLHNGLTKSYIECDIHVARTRSGAWVMIDAQRQPLMEVMIMVNPKKGVKSVTGLVCKPAGR